MHTITACEFPGPPAPNYLLPWILTPQEQEMIADYHWVGRLDYDLSDFVTEE